MNDLIPKSAMLLVECHLWYLLDELVRLALFADTTLSFEKNAMVKSNAGMQKAREGNWNILDANLEVSLSKLITERLAKLMIVKYR